MRLRTSFSIARFREKNVVFNLCLVFQAFKNQSYNCCCCCCCWSANTPICSFSISIICSSRCNCTINGTTKTKNVVPNVHAACPVENAQRMQCSFVFSQSRVLDFLDAFDENESAVPGTISIFFFFFFFFFFFVFFTRAHTLSLFLCCVLLLLLLWRTLFFFDLKGGQDEWTTTIFTKKLLFSPSFSLFPSFSPSKKGADSGRRYLKAVHSVFPKNGIHKLRLTRALNKTFSFYHDF